LEIKIACTQWEGSKCLDFFPLGFGEGRGGGGGRGAGGGGFFSFFLCSQHVPFKFPSGSQCVLEGCSQEHLTFIPYMLG